MATARNTGAFDFPTPSGTQQDPTQVSLMTAATGGTELYRDDLDTNVDAPTDGATVRFGAGTLVVEIPNGDATTAGTIRALNGMLAGNVFVRLLQASNAELSGNGYARVSRALATWTIA